MSSSLVNSIYWKLLRGAVWVHLIRDMSSVPAASRTSVSILSDRRHSSPWAPATPFRSSALETGSSESHSKTLHLFPWKRGRRGGESGETRLRWDKDNSEHFLHSTIFSVYSGWSVCFFTVSSLFLFPLQTNLTHRFNLYYTSLLLLNVAWMFVSVYNALGNILQVQSTRYNVWPGIKVINNSSKRSSFEHMMWQLPFTSYVCENVCNAFIQP
jgi:hypothetical protein